jgi:hypothetical protein
MAKKEYFVGWNHKSPGTVYGEDRDDSAGWVNALTLPQARKQVLKLGKSTKKRCIFKLVKVEEVPND